MATSHPAAKRSKVDKRVAAAHERVLEMWSDDRVSELSDIVRTEPMYEPLKPSEVEFAFYATRERIAKDIEMEPVTEPLGDAEVVVDYAPKSE